MALASMFSSFKTQEYVMGTLKVRYGYFYMLLLATPLVIYAAHRGYIGDTMVYMFQYEALPVDLENFLKFLEPLKDKGYVVFTWICKQFIGDNRPAILTIIATFQLIPLVLVYRRYSESLFISIFLFVLSTDYLSWMMNGLRQFFAAVIIFCCVPLILKKKYISVILVIVFASTFHATALLMIPFVFLAQGPAFNKKSVAILFACILLIGIADQFTGFLDVLLRDTQYNNSVSAWTEAGDDGTSFFRVATYTVPVLIAFIQRKVIKQIDNPLINLCINMSLVGVGFYILSMFTSGIFIGRLPIYFTLYNYILLPWEIKYLFSRGSDSIVKICMFSSYFVFCIIQLGIL